VKKYNIILADPPWKYGSKELYGDKINGYKNGQRKRFKRLEDTYATMQLDEIKELPIKDIIDKDCACFLWVTDSHLKEGIAVLEAWGFKYKTIIFNWIKKTNKGNTCVNFAPWTLKSSEICLLGIRGRMSQYKKSNNVRQLVEAERTKHSKKPDEVIKRIEKLFGDLPRLEMFCRFPKQGWDSIGFSIDGKDIKESLNLL
jgi:N6-adenosine-specific RNA methylase IME4